MFSKKIAVGFLCLSLLLPLAFFLCRADNSLTSSFQRKKPKDWVEGPVKYIITSKEKKEYKKYNTRAEKERFIKLFWARRDPNVETYRNEFRDEFNRRVDYANKNFKERAFDGWETARGWIYIVFGPPSREWKQILSMGTRPAIFWLYDNPPSIYLRTMEALVFADIYKNGRYYLLRPMPLDYFDAYFQYMKGRSYFDLVPDEYFRALEEVNERTIVNPDLKYEDIASGRAEEGGVVLVEIPFQWEVDFVPAQDDKIQLNLKIVLKYIDITYYEKDSKYQTTLGLSVKLFGEAEQPIAEFKDEIHLSLTEDELKAKAKEKLEYNGLLLAMPGEYDIEIELRDIKSGIGKTVTEKLTVVSKSQ